MLKRDLKTTNSSSWVEVSSFEIENIGGTCGKMVNSVLNLMSLKDPWDLNAQQAVGYVGLRLSGNLV